MLNLINLVILVGAGLLMLSTFTSLLSRRLGVAILLMFLGIGLLVGTDGPGDIDFDNAPLAYFIGSLAMAVILFDAGFETPWSTWRLAAGPGLMLATLGVLATAGLVGVTAVYLMGVDWITSLLLGAIVASTDAAAVFLLLRMSGVVLRERVKAILEIESGSNRPGRHLLRPQPRRRQRFSRRLCRRLGGRQWVHAQSGGGAALSGGPHLALSDRPVFDIGPLGHAQPFSQCRYRCAVARRGLDVGCATLGGLDRPLAVSLQSLRDRLGLLVRPARCDLHSAGHRAPAQRPSRRPPAVQHGLHRCAGRAAVSRMDCTPPWPSG